MNRASFVKKFFIPNKSHFSQLKIFFFYIKLSIRGFLINITEERKMETILLVEAMQKHAEMMRTHLEKHRYKVTVCTSVAQAQDALTKQLPTILVIDLNSADDDFFSFFHWMSQVEEIAKIPRLFITGKMQTNIAQQLEKDYKETILSKPLDINRFTSTLSRLKSDQSPILRKNREQDYFSSLIGKRIGPATIKKEIGRGGMGAVFLGYQESLDRDVAIKVLLPGMVGDNMAISRFQREALAIAKLKSPHIVQVFDFGEYDNNTLYISMEYLQGQTVDQYLKRNGSFPIEKAISVITQVANGLTVAHDTGLIHRDIKPSNLIMNNQGHVTITDFGLVRPQKKVGSLQSGVIVGSPHYMPPEQISDAPLDLRSDIYSLGIVFYHLIAGHPPYLASNPMEILMKHLNEPLPRLRDSIPQIPQPLIDIMERMTAKDPANRYINCLELLWDLKSQERKFSGSHRSSTPSTTNYISDETEVQKFSLASSFHPIFTELQKQSPALFTEKNLMGSITLTESGSLLESQGKFPEEWKNTLFILQESTKQLNAAVKLGKWKFKLVETPEEVLTLFPMPQSSNLGTMLFNQKDSGTFSSASLKATSATFSAAKKSRDPLRQMASIAEVGDILLLDQDGNISTHFLNDPRDLEEYKCRFPPVAQILQSISFNISGIDLWFDKGRVLVWILENSILFIKAGLDISRSFLSIYITAHLEQLNDTTHTNTKDTPLPSIPETKSVAEPVPVKLMDSIQLKLARIIGPIAKILISKECKTLGYSRRNFPEDLLDKMIQNLSQKINEPDRQQLIENLQDTIFDFRNNEPQT
jgi:serine/threonine protein kinase/ActR/RegA family two-component response regulator